MHVEGRRKGRPKFGAQYHGLAKCTPLEMNQSRTNLHPGVTAAAKLSDAQQPASIVRIGVLTQGWDRFSRREISTNGEGADVESSVLLTSCGQYLPYDPLSDIRTLSNVEV